MNPKAEIFFDAITLLPEDIVEEAQNYRFRKKQTVWKKIGSLAACLVLIASISLLMLPRGCGGSGSDSADFNSSGASMAPADSCAPADSEVSGDSAPELGAPAGTPEDRLPEHGCQTQVDAVIIEIYDTSMLVEALEDQAGWDLCIVSINGLELPELAAGDKVRITYEGWVAESYPGQIFGTTAIERLEEE